MEATDKPKYLKALNEYVDNMLTNFEYRGTHGEIKFNIQKFIDVQEKKHGIKIKYFIRETDHRRFFDAYEVTEAVEEGKGILS